MKPSFVPSFLIAVLLCAAGSARAVATRVSLSRGPAYDVRITPTVLAAGSTSIDIGPNLWQVQGFDIRGLLAQVYGIEPTRIDLHLVAPSSGSGRFDISLPLLGDESEQTVRTILATALRSRFHVAAALEIRSVDVYVLTAPAGPGSGLHPVHTSLAHPGPPALSLVKYDAKELSTAAEVPMAEIVTVSGRNCPGISSGGMTAHPATVASLARTLEQELDTPTVDETHLVGLYNFEIPEYRSPEQLFALLHKELGVDISPARREVTMLTVHPGAGAADATQTASLTQ